MKTILHIVLHIFGGAVAALFTTLLAGAVFLKFPPSIEIQSGGHAAFIYGPLCGIAAGCPLGFFLIDKFIFHVKASRRIAVLLSLAAGIAVSFIIGSVFNLTLLVAIVYVPVSVLAVSYLFYLAGTLLGKEKEAAAPSS